MSDPPPESHRLDPDHHPTPFSAVEIQEASGQGTSVTYRIEADGAEPYLDRWEFLGGDEERGRRRRWTESLDGAVIEQPAEFESSWLDLQQHALFPVATTRLTGGSAVTPAGEFDCWVYVTSNDDGSTTIASFARSEPGPPVLMETRKDGRTVFSMTLVAVSRPV